MIFKYSHRCRAASPEILLEMQIFKTNRMLVRDFCLKQHFSVLFFLLFSFFLFFFFRATSWHMEVTGLVELEL